MLEVDLSSHKAMMRFLFPGVAGVALSPSQITGFREKEVTNLCD